MHIFGRYWKITSNLLATFQKMHYFLFSKSFFKVKYSINLLAFIQDWNLHILNQIYNNYLFFQVFPKRNEWRVGSELVDFHFDVGVYSGVFQKSLSSLQVDRDPIRDQSGCAGKNFWHFSPIFGNFLEG